MKNKVDQWIFFVLVSFLIVWRYLCEKSLVPKVSVPTLYSGFCVVLCISVYVQYLRKLRKKTNKDRFETWLVKERFYDPLLFLSLCLLFVLCIFKSYCKSDVTLELFCVSLCLLHGSFFHILLLLNLIKFIVKKIKKKC